MNVIKTDVNREANTIICPLYLSILHPVVLLDFSKVPPTDSLHTIIPSTF